jgi:hypothetical protein
MRPVRLLVVTALAGACASGRAGTAAAPGAAPLPGAAPSTSPAVPAQPTPPLSPTPSPPSAGVRYGPGALRYLVHRQLHIQQTLGDQVQAQNLGARIFVTMAITGPADSVGYPTTFSVDSIVADSGTPAPVADNIVKVRKLVFAGRVARRGEFVNALPSDSALAQSVAQLLGNFRDFLPRLPADGVKPGATWTDTVETTQKSGDATSSRRATIHATATPWQDRTGVSGVRVETSQAYHVTGSGKNAGQLYELSGEGTASGTAFLAADGRYMAGEVRDSTALTIRLPVQGVSVPVVQVAHTAVSVLP